MLFPFGAYHIVSKTRRDIELPDGWKGNVLAILGLLLFLAFIVSMVMLIVTLA